MDGLLSAHCRQAHISAAEYRPDIDGLRALAVLSVLLFHAFPSLLPGGFVGVDVFFVISGYLISRHIYSELESGSFTIGRFYIKRVKRIFPALLLVLLAVTLFGWAILTPVEYEALGRPIAGGAGFVANLVFWKEAGYFDVAAETKPLLHLWSLGIEEQFYIVWPYLLAWWWRRQPGRLMGLISGLLLLSFAYSAWLVFHNATAAFYSPLSRFWELAVGAWLAHWTLHRAPPLAAGASRGFAALGLLLLVLGWGLIEKDAHFPGAWAALPTLGAAALIYSGHCQVGVRPWLAWRPLIWIGLISYPLYLWHWPLLSFARIMEADTPSVAVRGGMLLLSVLLALFTYRYVELPIRAYSGAKAKKIAQRLALLMLVLFCAGIAIRKLDGFKFRALEQLDGNVGSLVLGADRQHLGKDCALPEQARGAFQFCLSQGQGPAQVAVIGDSKAEALYYGLARHAGPDLPSIMIGTVSPPAPQARPEDSEQARKDLLAYQTALDSPSIKVVVLVNALRTTFAADNDTGFPVGDTEALTRMRLANYDHLLRQLQAKGKKVVLVIDNPTLPDPRSCVSGGMTPSPWLNQVIKRKPHPRCTISYQEHVRGTAPYRALVQAVQAQHPELTVFDPTPLLCDVAHDRCTMIDQGQYLYSYSDHLSDFANSRLAAQLLPIVARLRHQAGGR